MAELTAVQHLTIFKLILMKSGMDSMVGCSHNFVMPTKEMMEW